MRVVDAFKTGFLDWAWEEIIPSSGSEPSGNRGGALFARNGSGVFVLVGGRTAAGTDLADYWSFDLGGTNQWTQVVSSGLTNVSLPSGYADGSGNILISPSNQKWDQFIASTSLSKIAVVGGAQTSLTESGTGASIGTPAQFTVDISNKRIYSGRVGTSTYYTGETLVAAVQDTTANTSVKTAYTSATTSRVGASSLGYYPAGNSLYCLTAPSTSAWTLSTSCVYKYDLTLGTGWAVESGVTNNAGSVSMPAWPSNQNQMVWSATEGKFFIFVAGASTSCGRVLTYDPSSKILAEALFAGSAPAYILGAYDGFSIPRGNAGTLVESSGIFYFCTCADNASLTSARIWRFYRT